MSLSATRFRFACASAMLLACGGTSPDGATPPQPDASAPNDSGAPGAHDSGSPSAKDAATPDTGSPPPKDAAAPDTGGPIDAGPPLTSSFQLDGVATWRGDATGAYSLIHDDVCDPSVMGVFASADPELTKRGLHGGFGVIAGKCDAAGSGTWAQVQGLLSDGHDVFNHSWSHPCMTNNASLASSCDPAAPESIDFATEIGKSGAALQTNLGVSLDFFIFPYDVCDPAAITYLQNNGYLGARCGALDVNQPGFTTPFAVNFDVFGPSYSRFFGQGACAKTAANAAPVQWTTVPADYTDACRLYVLNQHVDDAIAAGGWAVREMHGFDPLDNPNGGWETVTVPDYQAHLDYLVTKVTAGQLWVEGPSRVLRYRFARDAQNCALPTIAGGRTLTFAAPSAGCQKYATVLSYKVSTTDGSDPASVQVSQGSVLLPAKRVSAGHYVVDADPTKGDAEIVR